MCVDGGPNFGQIGWFADRPLCKGRVPAADFGPMEGEQNPDPKQDEGFDPNEELKEPF